MESVGVEGKVSKKMKSLWGEFLNSDTREMNISKKRGERMKRLSEKWKNKMSGLATVSIEYLEHIKKEQDEMKYLIAAKEAEIKDLKERLSYLEAIIEDDVSKGEKVELQ